MRIAYLEDDPAQAQQICAWLADADYDCHHYDHGAALLRALHAETFDLAIIDWELPDCTGDEILTRLRAERASTIPIICITVRDREEDIVHALSLGADDYMCKPVSRGETLARIEALMRRTVSAPQTPVLQFAPYELNTDTQSITRDGEDIQVTQMEFELTVFLFRNIGRLLSRAYILESVWGTRGDLNTRTVDTHVSRIRNKLSLSPQLGWNLRSIYKHGYRLERVSQAA